MAQELQEFRAKVRILGLDGLLVVVLIDVSRSVTNSSIFGKFYPFTQVWDLTAPGTGSHIPHRPTYILHPSFAVRRVVWRPEFECEIALVSSTEFGTGSSDPPQAPPGPNTSVSLTRAGSSSGLDSVFRGSTSLDNIYAIKDKLNLPTVSEPKASRVGDSVEIWDVRRGWIAKWSVTGSAGEGGVSGRETF